MADRLRRTRARSSPIRTIPSASASHRIHPVAWFCNRFSPQGSRAQLVITSYTAGQELDASLDAPSPCPEDPIYAARALSCSFVKFRTIGRQSQTGRKAIRPTRCRMPSAQASITILTLTSPCVSKRFSTASRQRRPSPSPVVGAEPCRWLKRMSSVGQLSCKTD